MSIYENMLNCDFLKKSEIEVSEKGMVTFLAENSTFSLLEQGNHQLNPDTLCQDGMSKEIFILTILANFYLSEVRKSAEDFDKFLNTVTKIEMELLQNPQLRDKNEYYYVMSHDLEIIPNELDPCEDINVIFGGKKTWILSREKPVQDFVDHILNGSFDYLPVQSMMILDFLTGSGLLIPLYMSEKGIENIEEDFLEYSYNLSKKLGEKSKYFNEIIEKYRREDNF